MDRYQFVADIFRSIVSVAWPVAFVIAIYLFREKLNDLLPLLRLKYKDLDVSFRLDQAEQEAEALPPYEESSEPTPEETDKFRRLAQISPSSAIAEKSRDVEQALAEFSDAVGLKETRKKGWLNWTRVLRKEQLIDSATAALLDDLRAVRNTAVHGGSGLLSEEEAHRFGALADKLISSLQISTAAALQRGQPSPLDPHPQFDPPN
jgi:hypothetical protein